jgi:tetratricopeptide (TPR) repeat protein
VGQADVLLAAEAHKCLANVELHAARTIQIQGDKTGGFIGGGYRGPGVAAALAHLDAGIALSPDDLTIHQGRLHVLFASASYGRMAPALQDSLSRYHGPDALDEWLAYSGELDDARANEAAVEFMRVLSRHYPNDHRVAANLGAFLKRTGHAEEGLSLMEKAVALAPDDAYDNWNLGLILADGGQLDRAEAHLRRGLAAAGADDRDSMACGLGLFLEEKRGNPPEACTLEKKSCPAEERKACGKRPRKR